MWAAMDQNIKQHMTAVKASEDYRELNPTSSLVSTPRWGSLEWNWLEWSGNRVLVQEMLWLCTQVW